MIVSAPCGNRSLIGEVKMVKRSLTSDEYERSESRNDDRKRTRRRQEY